MGVHRAANMSCLTHRRGGRVGLPSGLRKRSKALLDYDSVNDGATVLVLWCPCLERRQKETKDLGKEKKIGVSGSSAAMQIAVLRLRRPAQRCPFVHSQKRWGCAFDARMMHHRLPVRRL